MSELEDGRPTLDQLGIDALLAHQPHLAYANASVFSKTRIYAGPLCAEAHSFHYVLYGEGRIEIGDEAHEVDEGTLVGVPWGSRMDYWASPQHPFTTLGLHLYFGANIDPLTLRGIRHHPRPEMVNYDHAGRLKNVSERVFVHRFERGNALERVWLDLVEEFSLSREGRARALQSQLTLLLLEIARREKTSGARREPYEQLVQSLKQFIRANPAHPHRRKELALLFNMSPGYMAETFRRVTGMGLQEFIIRTRLELARNMLVARKCNVKEAAGASGFHDGRHLMRAFRKYYGCTPKEYQMKHWSLG